MNFESLSCCGLGEVTNVVDYFSEECQEQIDTFNRKFTNKFNNADIRGLYIITIVDCKPVSEYFKNHINLKHYTKFKNPNSGNTIRMFLLEHTSYD